MQTRLLPVEAASHPPFAKSRMADRQLFCSCRKEEVLLFPGHQETRSLSRSSHSAAGASFTTSGSCLATCSCDRSFSGCLRGRVSGGSTPWVFVRHTLRFVTYVCKPQPLASACAATDCSTGLADRTRPGPDQRSPPPPRPQRLVLCLLCICYPKALPRAPGV